MTAVDARLVVLVDLLAQLDDTTVLHTGQDPDGWTVTVQPVLCDDCEYGHPTEDGWVDLELLAHLATDVDDVTMTATATFPAGNPGRTLTHRLTGTDVALDDTISYLRHLLTDVYRRGGRTA
ncbi:hypothetical protein [Euzebya sp.]|uniref:hypothetical protein n=1 Tax=Euzebya sp. TaxID=1971409 RepID=UPI0035112F61